MPRYDDFSIAVDLPDLDFSDATSQAAGPVFDGEGINTLPDLHFSEPVIPEPVDVKEPPARRSWEAVLYDIGPGESMGSSATYKEAAPPQSPAEPDAEKDRLIFESAARLHLRDYAPDPDDSLIAIMSERAKNIESFSDISWEERDALKDAYARAYTGSAIPGIERFPQIDQLELRIQQGIARHPSEDRITQLAKELSDFRKNLKNNQNFNELPREDKTNIDMYFMNLAQALSDKRVRIHNQPFRLSVPEEAYRTVKRHFQSGYFQTAGGLAQMAGRWLPGGADPEGTGYGATLARWGENLEMGAADIAANPELAMSVAAEKNLGGPGVLPNVNKITAIATEGALSIGESMLGSWAGTKLALLAKLGPASKGFKALQFLGWATPAGMQVAGNSYSNAWRLLNTDPEYSDWSPRQKHTAATGEAVLAAAFEIASEKISWKFHGAKYSKLFAGMADDTIGTLAKESWVRTVGRYGKRLVMAGSKAYGAELGEEVFAGFGQDLAASIRGRSKFVNMFLDNGGTKHAFNAAVDATVESAIGVMSAFFTGANAGVRLMHRANSQPFVRDPVGTARRFGITNEQIARVVGVGVRAAVDGDKTAFDSALAELKTTHANETDATIGITLLAQMNQEVFPELLKNAVQEREAAAGEVVATLDLPNGMKAAKERLEDGSEAWFVEGAGRAVPDLARVLDDHARAQGQIDAPAREKVLDRLGILQGEIAELARDIEVSPDDVAQFAELVGDEAFLDWAESLNLDAMRTELLTRLNNSDKINKQEKGSGDARKQKPTKPTKQTEPAETRQATEAEQDISDQHQGSAAGSQPGDAARTDARDSRSDERGSLSLEDLAAQVLGAQDLGIAYIRQQRDEGIADGDIADDLQAQLDSRAKTDRGTSGSRGIVNRLSQLAKNDPKLKAELVGVQKGESSRSYEQLLDEALLRDARDMLELELGPGLKIKTAPAGTVLLITSETGETARAILDDVAAHTDDSLTPDIVASLLSRQQGREMAGVNTVDEFNALPETRRQEILDQTSLDGFYDRNTKTIHIDRAMHRDADTWMHEIFHWTLDLMQEADRQQIISEYGSEDAAAEAYRQWRIGEQDNISPEIAKLFNEVKAGIIYGIKRRKKRRGPRVGELGTGDALEELIHENGGIAPLSRDPGHLEEWRRIPKRLQAKKGRGLPADMMAQALGDVGLIPPDTYGADLLTMLEGRTSPRSRKRAAVVDDAQWEELAKAEEAWMINSVDVPVSDIHDESSFRIRGDDYTVRANMSGDLIAKSQDGDIIDVPAEGYMRIETGSLKQPAEVKPDDQEAAKPEDKTGGVPFQARPKEPIDLNAADIQQSVKAIDDILKFASPAHRNLISRKGARIIRRRLAEARHKAEITRAKLEPLRRELRKLSREEVFDFYDAIETGKKIKEPGLAKIARTVRGILDGRRKDVQDLGTGKLQHFYENFFPHIWKDPDNAGLVIARILKNKPLQGSASFLKPRTHATIREGTEAGLELVTEDLVELVMLKTFEMDRYVMGQKIMDDLNEHGLATFVYATSPPPPGYVAIDDRVATKFGPPEISYKEAYDKGMFDKLESIAKRLGVDHKRLAKIGGTRWGYAQGDSVVTKFAGPESVLMHELGHILGDRYNLHDWLVKGSIRGATKKAMAEDRRRVKGELRDLTDLRYKGLEARTPESYKRYVRKKAEKEAVLLEALLHAPEQMKQYAPTIYSRFTEFLRAHEELSELLDVKPGLVLDEASASVKIPGITIIGKYHAPEPVARLINNLLSPGLRDNWMYDAARKLGNTMNQMQLAISVFHGLNTTTDVLATYIGTAVREIIATRGMQLKGLKTLAQTPIAPIHNFTRGHQMLKAYRADPLNIKDPRMRLMLDALEYAGGSGRMDPFYYNDSITAIRRTLLEIRRDKGFRKFAKTAKLPHQAFGVALQLLAKPVLEELVPRQKQGAFMLLAQHEMQRHRTENLNDEKLWESLTQAWDSVDNRMGQLGYDNLFWNKVLKDLAMLAVRSVGWNLGSWREYGGAFVDVATTRQRMQRGDAWLSHKMGYVIGAVVNYGVIGAVLQYLMSGLWPQELKDYFFPRTGRKNPDGAWERISLPTYAKDWFAYAESPVKTITHKLHPMWSMFAQMIQNQDYYGTEIRNPDDPRVQQTKDVADYIAKNFLPFSLRNYQRMRKAGASRAEASSSFLGILAAPASVSRTPAHTLMMSMVIGKMSQGTKTKKDFDKAQLKKDLTRKARAGEDWLTREAMENFTPKELDKIAKRAAEDPQRLLFKRLGLREALRVFAIASPEEKAAWGDILDDKFKRLLDPQNPDVEEYIRIYKDIR